MTLEVLNEESEALPKVWLASCPGSAFRFCIREEAPDYVVAFGRWRLQWCETFEKAKRAIRLWDALYRRKFPDIGRPNNKAQALRAKPSSASRKD